MEPAPPAGPHLHRPWRCTVMSVPRLTYVLPVHNSAAYLQQNVDALRERLRDVPGSEVILVENGSRDASLELCRRLAADHRDANPRVVAARSRTGLGYAFRVGLALAHGDVVVLSADDLPFRFTDLDAWLASDPRPRIACGSKAHPASLVEVSPLRRVLSWGFRIVRRRLVGLEVDDSQGTLILARDLADSLLPHLVCGDYLISTEILCWAVRAGEHPVELPVVYRSSGESTVSPLRDSVRMTRGLWWLRRRLHRTRTPDPVATARSPR